MKKKLLLLELIAIFGLLPLVIFLTRTNSWIVLLLWALSGGAWVILWCKGYSWRQEWNRSALTWPVLRPLMARFLFYALLITAFTCVLVPDRLLNFPLQNTRMWLVIMLLYPLLSVIPQEVIFRCYFMKRFAPLLSNFQLKLLSSASFGWVHIIMHNWIAVVFCMMGGWLFADTYNRTRSLAAVSLEHSLYGCFVFTIGLGAFFYHGAVH